MAEQVAAAASFAGATVEGATASVEAAPTGQGCLAEDCPIPTASEPTRPCEGMGAGEKWGAAPPAASEPARPIAGLANERMGRRARMSTEPSRRLSTARVRPLEEPILAMEASSDLLLYRPEPSGSFRSRSDASSKPCAAAQSLSGRHAAEVAPADPADESSGLTATKLAMAALLNLVDCINMNLLTPYAAEMVARLLEQPVHSPEVLRKVGLLVGVYNMSEMIFSPSWGRLSDRWGRRPVLLASLGGAALVPIVFGLSGSFEMALAVRALNGVLCGSIGITKTYVAELVDKEHEARAFSILTTCYSVGMILGPAIGGQLQSPASWSQGADAFFSRPVLRIFKDEPFLLPNLVFSIFACTVWVLAYFFLQESLPRSKRIELREAAAAAKSERQSAAAKVGKAAGWRHRSWEALIGQLPFFNYPGRLLRAMAAYGLAVGYVIATVQNIMLLYQIPVEDNGFGLGPTTLGLLQNCAALGLLVTQLVLYPALVQLKGYRWCVIAGLCAVLAVTLPMPLYGLMSDPEAFGGVRLVPLVFMMVIQQAAFGFCTPTTTVWINRFADGQDRGEVNGWANSFAALCRALAPILVGFLQSIGAAMGFEGGRYLALYVISLMATAISALLLPVLPKGPMAPAKPLSEKTEENPAEDSDNEDEETNELETAQDFTKLAASAEPSGPVQAPARTAQV